MFAHKPRHTFGTNFAIRTPNAILLADVLGHETLDMSKRYVHLAGVNVMQSSSVMDDILGSVKHSR